MDVQVWVSIELLGYVKSVSCQSFFRSWLIMPDSFGDDEALPEAQVCVVDCKDTAFCEANWVKEHNQQWLIREDQLKMDMVKFDALFINSRIVSYSQGREVSSAPNPFVVQV